MQYFGGKARVGSKIVEYLNGIPHSTYYEPFVGGAWIMSRMATRKARIASDICVPIIALYKALQDGWEPPDYVSEEDYAWAKSDDAPLYFKAFAGFGCSFAGKWFGGYARGGHGADAKTAPRSLDKKFNPRNYAMNAKMSSLSKLGGLSDVSFFVADYNQLPLIAREDWLIYCDPPYAGTTGYAAAGKYDADNFWGRVRQWSTQCAVVVSEYKAPDDFKCVAEFTTRTDIRNKLGLLEPRMERLFRHESQI